ncbi:MAG: hypothetical protein GF410_08615 [Chitinivibrionales bacterium]|nr:hypothetical protein [Chitinivibrionales bacterium]
MHNTQAPPPPHGGDTKKRSVLAAVREYLTVIHQILVIIAILAGAIWFIQRKVASPKISVSHRIVQRRVHENVRWVAIDVLLENKGVVPVHMQRSLMRVQRIIPLHEEIEERLNDGFDLVLQEKHSVEWPALEQQESNTRVTVLPGETRVVSWEVGIDSHIGTVRVYSFFSPSVRDTLGWAHASVHDMEDEI